jgi:hypothetical protein
MALKNHPELSIENSTAPQKQIIENLSEETIP